MSTVLQVAGIREQLSDLQQKILKHFFECPESNENISHISKEINALQPAVFRSIKSLIDNNYLMKHKEFTDGGKTVTLTEKGAAVAVLLGISYDQVKNYLNKDPSPSLFNLHTLFDLIREPDKKDHLLQRAVEFLIKKNLYYPNKLGEREKLDLIAYLFADSSSRLDDDRKVYDYLNKVHDYIDIQLFKNTLKRREQFFTALLDKLDSKDIAALKSSIKGEIEDRYVEYKKHKDIEGNKNKSRASELDKTKQGLIEVILTKDDVKLIKDSFEHAKKSGSANLEIIVEGNKLKHVNPIPIKKKAQK
jgi:hypothetical protein